AIDDRPQVIEKCWKAEGVKVLAAEWHGEAQPTAQAPANAPVLILLVGPSCAGKSTYILANFDPHVFYVLSSDVLRQTITGDFKDQTRNDEVFARLHTITKELLWSGNNVVVDATNIRDADRKKFLELAPPNAHIEYHVFNRPMEQKYKDAGWRAELPFDLIAKHENTFNSNLKNILKGDNDPRVTVCDLRSK
ncbi:MAG: AAA family ATPase, partial [Pseudomonadota bacterium]|nr:AAA family ATPase [Pseudomonadota bacterium]